jgi:hypothetical protein
MGVTGGAVAAVAEAVVVISCMFEPRLVSGPLTGDSPAVA